MLKYYKSSRTCIPVSSSYTVCSALVNELTCDLFNGAGPHVEQHGAVQDAGPQLKQTVEGQRGHVRFTPTFTSVFYVLLELQPPDDDREIYLNKCPILT